MINKIALVLGYFVMIASLVGAIIFVFFLIFSFVTDSSLLFHFFHPITEEDYALSLENSEEKGKIYRIGCIAVAIKNSGKIEIARIKKFVR